MDIRTCKTLILYGGSFDPPHRGHVELPAMAMEKISADAVAYIPSGQSPHKIDIHQTPAHHRLAMLRLALENSPRSIVLTDEMDRPGPSYTIDTLHTLRARLGPIVEFRLLIGADMLRIFPQWRDPAGILALAEPLVMLRQPDDDRQQLLATLPADYNRAAWSTRFIELPRIDISSSEIRARVAAGKSIKGMVAAGVEAYIRENGLYRD